MPVHSKKARTDSNRAPSILLAVIVVLAALALLLYRAQTSIGAAAPSATERGSEQDERRSVRGGRRHDWNDVRASAWREPSAHDARAAAPETGELAPSDAGVPVRPDPFPAEQGPLRESYARWAADPDLPRVTTNVREHLTTMLGDFDVHPREVNVSCTGEICRAELAFDSTDALQKLAAIPHDMDRMRLGSAQTERDVRLIAYWDREEDTPF